MHTPSITIPFLISSVVDDENIWSYYLFVYNAKKFLFAVINKTLSPYRSTYDSSHDSEL